MKQELKNKNVIITGGTGGIGRAVTSALLENGAKVLVISSTRNKVKDIKNKIRSKNLYALVADVSERESHSRIKRFIDRYFKGRVDVLINAAGIYGPIGMLESISPKDWVETFSVNVFGTVYMCMLVIPYMKKRKRGKIINFSGGGDGPFPRFTAYSSSKTSILRFTESLGEELKDYNIQVNAIAPGPVNTDFLEKVLRAGPKKAGEDNYKKALKQKEEGGVSPKKSAELILFLCSDKSGELNGKLFSSVWDDWRKFPKRAKKIKSTDIYNIRRVNPKDRGLDW